MGNKRNAMGCPAVQFVHGGLVSGVIAAAGQDKHVILAEDQAGMLATSSFLSGWLRWVSSKCQTLPASVLVTPLATGSATLGILTAGMLLLPKSMPCTLDPVKTPVTGIPACWAAARTARCG